MLRQYINIIMGILYALIGGFTMAKNWFLIDLSPLAAKSLGVLFIAYGIFRIYRAVKAIRSQDY